MAEGNYANITISDLVGITNKPIYMTFQESFHKNSVHICVEYYVYFLSRLVTHFLQCIKVCHLIYSVSSSGKYITKCKNTGTQRKIAGKMTSRTDFTMHVTCTVCKIINTYSFLFNENTAKDTEWYCIISKI